jgi:hypothetical protein
MNKANEQKGEERKRARVAHCGWARSLTRPALLIKHGAESWPLCLLRTSCAARTALYVGKTDTNV